MNNDPTPSSAARQPTVEDPPDQGLESRHDGDHANRAEVEDSERRSARHLHKAGLTKKLRFMTQLLKNLDTLVYAELSALYYMECSFIRFCIRSFAQFTFLTPKSDSFPLIMPAARTHVISIFLPNAICILLHILTSLPTASEESRGYFHGGIIVDFIGQKAPASKLPLLLLDFAVLVLQCFMLAVHSQREKLRSALRPSAQRTESAGADATVPGGATTEPGEPMTTGTQDHDAEERGILRDIPESPENEADAELQSLIRESENERQPSRDRAAPDMRGFSSTQMRRRSRLADVMNSGNGLLGEFHVLHTIRTATTDYDGVAAHSIQTLGYTAAIAALTARRRAEAATGTR